MVLSGHRKGVAEAAKIAKATKAARRALELPVAGAFHSRLMQPAAKEFSDFLKDVAPSFQAPHTPIIVNITGGVVEEDGVVAAIEKQMLAPVRWADSLKTLDQLAANNDEEDDDEEEGHRVDLLELGPGTVLTDIASKSGLKNVSSCVALGTSDGLVAWLRDNGR